MDTGVIEVTQTLTAVGYRLEFARLKTMTSSRNATVDTAAMTLLADWRVRETAALAAAGVDNSHALVFTRDRIQPKACSMVPEGPSPAGASQ